MSDTNEWVSEEAAQIGNSTSRYIRSKDWPTKNGAKQAVIRILSSVFPFYEGWSGGKPIRASRPEDFPAGTVWDTDNKYGKDRVRTPAKCWGVYAYYADKPETILYWQISQTGIMQALLDLAQGPKGAPTKYDVVVTFREGKKPSPYSVQGLDSSPVNPVAEAAYKALLAAGAKAEGILTAEGPFPREGAAPAVDHGRNEIPF